VQRAFAKLPAPAQLTLDDTVARAEGLAMALLQFKTFFREQTKLESQVEFWLRKLIRKRSQGKLHWKGSSSPRQQPVRPRWRGVGTAYHCTVRLTLVMRVTFVWVPVVIPVPAVDPVKVPRIVMV